MTNTAHQPLEDAPSETPSALRVWLVLFAASLALYALTANRGAQWQDSGEHIWRVITGCVLNPRGLALSHPLHYYLARLAIAPGWFEPACAITLVSALFGAVAVANTYGCVLALTRNRTAAAIAAVSLATAHTVWQMATITETYTLVIALLSAELWAMVLFEKTGRPKFALLMALMNGLGIANHMLASLTTPLVLFVACHGLYRRRLTIIPLLGGMGLWLLGSFPYSAMCLAEWARSGDFSATLASALFGKDFASAVLNAAPTARNAAVTVGFVALNFPNLLLPLAAWGVQSVWRGGKYRLAYGYLFAALICHAIFAVRYKVVDQHTFFLPTYLLLCIFAGVRLAALLASSKKSTRRRIIATVIAALAITPIVYAVAPAAARSLHVLGGIERHKPYRDDYDYLLTPWSFAETSADRMSRHAVKLADDSAVIIVEDSMAEPAIRYQLRQQSRDNFVIPASDLGDIKAWASEHASFVLVPRDRNAPATPTPRGTWHRDGDLYTNTAPPQPPG